MSDRPPPLSPELDSLDGEWVRIKRPSPHEHPLRDRTIRLLGVPFFGLIIPRVSGNFAHLGPADAAYWLGTAWFIVLSLTLWQGNRTIHYWLRNRIERLQRPVWKFAALLATNILFTIPASIAMFAAWYLVGPFDVIDWPALGRATAFSAAAVLFVSHAYETVFLIHDRRDERMHAALAERARWQAELSTLRGQLAPHFLFNCLNTLSVLIAEEPRTARKFNLHLANLCRYLLAHKEHDLVSLDEELAFFAEYVALARIRHRDALEIVYRNFNDTRSFRLPPASLQLLLENVLKHNACSPEHPLPVELALEDGLLTVSNPLRSPSTPPRNTGTGLRNLRDRFRLVTQREIAVQRTPTHFRVTLPLVRT
jgi:Putative regulator of cell autolysis